MRDEKRRINRREFLKDSTIAAAALTGALRVARVHAGTPRPSGRKMIILAFDAMDPRLTERMMDAGELPNMNRLRQAGGYRRLGTTIPPQTPVAFATFITGLNPGGHGIFDFVHRDPANGCTPTFAAAGISPGTGYWEVGQHTLQLDFWPFRHQTPHPTLNRRGIPFWEYLDHAGFFTQIYEIPSNYPPSRSRAGHHRALAGLGTPDMQGGYGTYQYYTQNGPYRPTDEPDGGGIRDRIIFRNHTAEVELRGPMNTFLKQPLPCAIKFLIHRDRQADAAVIEIQGQMIPLKRGQWSDWVRLEFAFKMPSFLPDQHQRGICRFYLQEVSPNCRLYVTPINIDPSDPALPISEPKGFVNRISDELGLFYTAGFQEDHKALSNGVFTDDEYAAQADMVLDERMEMLDYALRHFDEGLLFFYFAGTDLQAHMFWWDADGPHPVRSPEDARKCHGYVKRLYQKMDAVVGEVLDRHGKQALVMAMSDHGMANFRRQFSLCRWLRDNGYLAPADCKSLYDRNMDWSHTSAYGLGLNSLYLNLKGRERDGIVEPGAQRERLLAELVAKLEAIRDADGSPVIRKVYRGDQVYSGDQMALAPDLILGYHRDYRCSWATAMGDMTEEVLADNKKPWAADHCLAAEDVPGILVANRPIRIEAPTLLDLAPTILAEFGLDSPAVLVGQNILDTVLTT